ncbi:alpha/beta hydrolase [Streptomyces lunaelactis]|uniref:alpha/beta fold hydrolase n=1 Tax=Streptomyces lunaelactis TaxID=1535768 RepID=UPI001584CE83|nr:alpha/beta hydrolase [Streptomyces lunaelactis]NUK32875.1 alpha/beta hydrolase [Streptomyces lunaelactis]NUK43212.1 alpha/beta hydrolase [Streptomyces lunaelactis]NUK59139.1 alpha/beta hydrolase [Streptomyces lunaelactis]NUK94558.1 alpha/beta hydrolase [Streptomyces lunaelactis]NUL32684.1 alpha/beta hydrolase [Streptomyces lunaelactis]
MTTISLKTAPLREGLTLPYAEAGYPGGTPVVFVHAIADSWWTFEHLLRRLPVSLHGYAPTQRGHGDADRPPDGYRPEDFAADLVAFLDTVGLERALLVGTSSGGVPARIVAGSHPDRISGLVLIGVPATLADKPAMTRIWKTVQGLSDPVPREFVEDLMTGMVARPVARGLIETMIDESLKVPAHVWRETLRGLLEADLPATLAGILVPTLVIWGDQDDFLPRSDQQAILDAIHGARLVTYEGAGHVVHWEQPERVIADLVDFAAHTAPASPGTT